MNAWAHVAFVAGGSLTADSGVVAAVAAADILAVPRGLWQPMHVPQSRAMHPERGCVPDACVSAPTETLCLGCAPPQVCGIHAGGQPAGAPQRDARGRGGRPLCRAPLLH